MEYQPEVHGDLLRRIMAVSIARTVARDRAKQKRRREHQRHREELRQISEGYDQVHENFSDLLNEAERMKLPTAAICEAVGLSRARISKIRRERKA